jgi:DNA-binding LacI/PurR family transcriptional regulator
MKRITIRDVARAAGVSLSTVSRVLHGNPTVRPDLQERVLETVQRLNYQPNRMAQRLRSNASNIIGLVISDIENPFFTSIVRGVEDVAYGQFMNVILCNTDEDPLKQRRYIDIMAEERAAGLIIAPVHEERTLDSLLELQKGGVPVVLVDRNIGADQIDAVLVDNFAGAYSATRHLIDCGRKRIAIVNGETRIETFADRYEGYARALADAGIPLDMKLVVETAPRINESQQATSRLLEADHKPDAIFAGNNLITLGVLKAAKQVNMTIPQDMALAGFDDMPWSSELCPSITSVAQPTYELGQEAARLLIRRMKDNNAFQQTTMMQTRLIVRESCGGLKSK